MSNEAIKLAGFDKSAKTIDLTPTWETGVRIYMMVLENPEAPEASKRMAREDLLKLASVADSIPKNAEQWSAAGERMAAELGIEPTVSRTPNDPRFYLMNGDKTHEGLARTIHRVITDPDFGEAPESKIEKLVEVKEDISKTVRGHRVDIEWHGAEDDFCNSIHVYRTFGGFEYSAEISQLGHKATDGKHYLECDEDDSAALEEAEKPFQLEVRPEVYQDIVKFITDMDAM